MFLKGEASNKCVHFFITGVKFTASVNGTGTGTCDELMTGVSVTGDKFQEFFLFMTFDVTPGTFIVGVADTSAKLKTIVNNSGDTCIFSVNHNVKVNDYSKSAIYHWCQQHQQ